MNSEELHVIYGDEPRKMVKKLLSEVGIEKEITPEMSVALKPNLILPSPSEEGATTSPELVAGIVEYLREKGIDNISIMESSWVGASTKRSFKRCGYDKLAARYNLPLYDLKKDSWRVLHSEQLDLKVCEKPLNADYLINLPVLKAHCQTRFTCAMKNLKGCIPDQEKRRFHSLGLHQPIAYLNKVLKSDLTIVDAVIGDLTFEEGGNPVQMNRLIMGKDPVLVDSYGASLIGYSPDDISYIKIAESICVGKTLTENTRIIEYNNELKSKFKIAPSRKVDRLAQYVEAREACSACYGSLIHALQRLADKGKLNQISKVYIGQGFKGEEKEGPGIGSCTAGFNQSLRGCPPTARAIVDFLSTLD